MKDKITLTVSKETLKEMYESGNETLKKIATEACPELTALKLSKFLEDTGIPKDSWDMLSIYGKAHIIASYFNKVVSWYNKTASAYGIYWNIVNKQWQACQIYQPYIGMVLFKTYDAATLATKILNESEAR